MFDTYSLVNSNGTAGWKNGSRARACSRGLFRGTCTIERRRETRPRPGKVAADGSGEHSPFTAAPLKHLGTPKTSLPDNAPAEPNSRLHSIGTCFRTPRRLNADPKRAGWKCRASDTSLPNEAPIRVCFQHASWIPVALARATLLLQIQRPLDPSRTPSANPLLPTILLGRPQGLV
jgi:hypothetical protein